MVDKSQVDTTVQLVGRVIEFQVAFTKYIGVQVLLCDKRDVVPFFSL